MRFGLFYLPVLRCDNDASSLYNNIIHEVKMADSWGWDNIWLAEHHFDKYGGVIPSPVQFGTVLALHTNNIRIGSAISILPLNNPFKLAEEFAMLDVVSKGRAEIGVGRGFLPHEFEKFQINREEQQSRFEEGLDILNKSWSNEVFSYTGKHFTFKNARLLPEPLQEKAPIWVAASRNQKSFELAGLNGYNLMINPFILSMEDIEKGITWYKEAYISAGHNIENARILANFYLYIAPTEQQAKEEPRDAILNYLSEITRASSLSSDSLTKIVTEEYDEIYPEKVMFGTPDTIIEKIKYWNDIGITDFSFMSQYGNQSLHNSLASISLFTKQVMPAFKNKNVMNHPTLI
jgi:natural product biosynthesis luciferase-like monooxygenase protein